MIFGTLFYMFDEPEMQGYEIVKVVINEVDEFGKVTVENPYGDIETYHWNKSVDIWIKE